MSESNLKYHLVSAAALFFAMNNISVYAIESSTQNTAKKESTKAVSSAPSPYGIELGKTTEEDIKKKYTVEREIVIDEHGGSVSSYNPFFQFFRLADNPNILAAPNMRILILDKKHFSKGTLPAERVSIALDKNKKVSFISIVYKKGMFNFLNKTLSKKYKVIDKSKRIFDDDFVIMNDTPSNTAIGLFETTKLDFFSKDPLSGVFSVVNYCSVDSLNDYKKWVQEKDKAAQDLL